MAEWKEVLVTNPPQDPDIRKRSFVIFRAYVTLEELKELYPDMDLFKFEKEM